MALRVYVCPWVGSGVKGDPYRSKAADLLPGAQMSTFFPSLADGTPASTWVVSFINASDFTAIDADTTCDDLFQGDLPKTIVDRASFLNYARTHTVGDVPVARRNAIEAVLTKYGIVWSDFTLTTPLWKLLQRVASTLFEKDDNFASDF